MKKAPHMERLPWRFITAENQYCSILLCIQSRPYKRKAFKPSGPGLRAGAKNSSCFGQKKVCFNPLGCRALLCFIQPNGKSLRCGFRTSEPRGHASTIVIRQS